MKKTLIGLMALAMSLPISAEGLYDKVKDYLNESGMPRAEYFMNHRMFFYRDGNFKYQQAFLLDGKPLIADFMPYNPQQVDENTMVADLDRGADIYVFDNTWYIDPECDGINGNEELFQGE